MIRGLFNAASGIVAMMQAQEVIINNIANVSTPGFKKDIPVYRSFSNILQRRIKNQESQARVEATFTDFSQGEIESTEGSLDLAIKGDGFFTLLTPQGIAYTRAGNFTLDKTGRIVTAEGYFLLGKNGPISVSGSGKSRLEVNSKGDVIVDGTVVDRIRVQVFPKPSSFLYKQGKNLFKSIATVPTVGKGGTYDIKQGYVELSNVDIVQEITDLLINLRLYESAQRAVQLQDETLGKICNGI